MPAEIIKLESLPHAEEATRRVARALAEGALVVFPTETVYGLAASAAISESVERLRAVKGRESTQPFTVHIGRRSEWEDYVPHPSTMARRLALKAWPGPMTMVHPVDDPSQAKIYSRLSANGVDAIYSGKSVGIRCPHHDIAMNLLSWAGVPVIASSANPAGVTPPTEGGTIADLLGDQVDIILDGGPTRYRQNSTVVAMNETGCRILRSGVLDERTLRRLATTTILLVCTGNTCRSPMAEGLLKQMLAAKFGCHPDELPLRGLAVQSAGTLAINGGRASSEAVEVCRRRGIDLSGHRSQGLSIDLLRQADYIYAMGRHHVEFIRSLAPKEIEKTASLIPGDDIEDPIGGTVEDYARVADKIAAALQMRIDEVAL